MNNRDYIILVKILAEISIIDEMVKDIDEKSFLEDEMLKRATSMTLINIGELIKNITHDTRQRYNCIPWKEISGLRDIAAHKYQTLKMEDIYITAKEDVKKLRIKISDIVSNIAIE